MEPKASKKRVPTELRFLIATDVHLGHAENHNELGNDSYIAFEQILSIAKRQEVDFLLLGGDLFDQVNPTQKCIFKCLNLLKDNIFGSRQLQFGVKGIVPNFSNLNLNISLPIFTIHGNHDYPSNDFGKISVCDLLHASNYVNYFGKQINLSFQGAKQIVVKPLIFQKGTSSTRLAIYGLGYIKDHKLHKIFIQKSVVFEKPQKQEETTCILILHQNRYKGKKGGVGASFENCIHADQLPKWMDLIIWGHQHEAIYKIETQSERKIFQPGSTVITSYIEAESLKKQCGLISVLPDKKYQLQYVLLQKSYRPMIIRSYSLSQIALKYEPDAKINFDQFFDYQLAKILNEFSSLHINKKPIIRIKIDYTGHQIIRLIRTQQKYREIVANSNKIFTYTQKRQQKKVFALQDNEVLDMIKKNRAPTNSNRQVQLTQQIMDIFAEEMGKNKLHFFNLGQLKDSIVELANNQGRANLGQLRQSYVNWVEKKVGDTRKDILGFQKNNQKQFNRIRQNLLKYSDDAVNGKIIEMKKNDIEADIARLKSSYAQKQKQVHLMSGQVHKKMSLDPTQTQVPTKSTSRSRNTNSSRPSILHMSQSDSDGRQGRSGRLSNSSDEDDCCVRAEREDYRENDTRQKFEKAHQMVENRSKKQGKGKQKKNVRFQKQ